MAPVTKLCTELTMRNAFVRYALGALPRQVTQARVVSSRNWARLRQNAGIEHAA